MDLAKLVLLCGLLVLGLFHGTSSAKNKVRRCGKWMIGPCIPANGVCGRGYKQGNRQAASSCTVITKKFKCHLPCLHSNTTDLSGSVCRYGRPNKKSWTVCDPVTMTTTTTLTLQSGNCEESKTISRRCKPKKSCRYRKHAGSCKPDGTKTIIFTLKKSDSSCQQTKTLVKKCHASVGKRQKTTKKKRKNSAKKQKKRKNAAKKQKKGKKVCKYSKTWSSCNEATNLQTKIVTLKKGNPLLCTIKSSQAITRKCKHACRFRKGKWTECDPNNMTRSRTDSIKKDRSAADCSRTRTIIKKCKCKFSYGVWGGCVGGFKRREKKVISGPAACSMNTDRTTKRCHKGLKKAPCRYTSWAKFGPCINGIETKIRTVITGGNKCNLKTVKQRKCTNK